MKTGLIGAVLNWYSPDHEMHAKFAQYILV
jgi:hypothetical protein